MSDLESFFHVAEKETKVKRALDRKKEAYRYVMSTEKGRLVLWDLLSAAGIFRTSFQKNENVFFNEGRRSVGIELLSQVERINPEALVEMMKENRQRQIADELAEQGDK